MDWSWIGLLAEALLGAFGLGGLPGVPGVVEFIIAVLTMFFV